MRLRNKEFNKLNNDEKIKIIDEIRNKYLVENLSVNDLIILYDSTKSFMFKFLKDNDIKKDKDILNKNRSIKNKNKWNDKTQKDIYMIKEKRKQTNLDRYGVENLYQSKEVKEKIKEECKNKYGVEYHNQRAEVKEKINQSTFRSQGAKRYIQTKEGKDKFKQVCQEKYGVDNPYKSKEVKEQIELTNIERYGFKTPSKSENVKEKIKQTKLEKYGNENYNNSIKISNTWNEKSIEEKNERTQKIKQTKLERYGDENYVNKEKIKESLNSRSYEDIIKTNEKLIKSWEEKTIEEKEKILEKRKNTNLKKYGLPWACMREDCRLHAGAISKINLSFKALLNKLNITHEMEFNLDSISFDFKVNNIVIEINPSYTHNSTKPAIFNNSKAKKQVLDKYYHLAKTNIAEENNYHCIHVFDWDDWNKIINLLTSKQVIYARNCELLEVSKQECDKFLNLYHLQNTCNGQKIRLGLYYNNQLIQIMTFGKPRYNKNYEYELLRLCSHKDYKIVGGSERLWKHFIKENNPKSIISYCDNSKFSGDVYKRLGLVLKNITKPACNWSKGKLKITDNLLRQRGFDQIFGTSFGKGTSNKQLMIEHGWLEVYDCGQKVFEWVNNVK